MRVSLLYRQRRRHTEIEEQEATSRWKPVQAASAPVLLHEAKETLEEAEGVVGFWCVPPPGANNYLKLPIQNSYKVGTKKTGENTISNTVSGKFVPVWSLLKGFERLASFFPWLKNEVMRAVKMHGDSSIYTDPKSNGHQRAVTRLVDAAMGRGWVWVAKSGNKATIGVKKGVDIPYIDALVAELKGEEIQKPSDVRIQVVQTLVVVDHSGSQIGKPIDLHLEDAVGKKQIDALRGKAAEVSKGAKDTTKKDAERAEKLKALAPKCIELLQKTTTVELLAAAQKEKSNNWMLNQGWVSGLASIAPDAASKKMINDYWNKVRGPYLVAMKKAKASKKASAKPAQAPATQAPATQPSATQMPVQSGLTASSPRANPLVEASFKQLLAATTQNGMYRRGGMRRIGHTWVFDPQVRGRIENSRFVITNPPTMDTGEDGFPLLRFNFKSRPDRSTTGQRAHGYVKMLPDRRARYEFGNKVHVMCGCPDFKYRWHKVLADKGAAAVPTGTDGQATNSLPLRTNPMRLPAMCKHLCCMTAYLSMRTTDFNKTLQDMAPDLPTEVPAVQPPPDADPEAIEPEELELQPDPEQPEPEEPDVVPDGAEVDDDEEEVDGSKKPGPNPSDGDGLSR